MRVIRLLRYLLGRRRAESDLAEEMAFHQAMHQRDLEAVGVAPHDAARTARRTFGSGALAANRARDVWLWPWLQDAAWDLHFAIRLLGRDRAFTAIIVTVLGLGVGVANLQFVLIDAICIRGLPIPDVDRVLMFGARDSTGRDLPLTFQEFTRIREATPGLAGIAAFVNAPGVLGDDQQAPDRVLVSYVSAPIFQILRESPLLGRAFDDADDRPGAEPVTVLTASVWRSRYGASQSIVGRVIRVDGTPTTVIGVMRDPLRFPNVVDVWRPLASMPNGPAERPAARSVNVVARLTDEANLAGVQASLASQSADLSRLYPAAQTGLTLTAVRINDRYNGRLTDGVWIAFGGVAVVVLLIACANAANLLLVRAGRRGHEIAIRASIGASRARIVRQMLVESVTLALVSGVAGAVLSALGLYLINRVIPENTLAYWMKFELDARGLVVLLALCLGTVLAFGLAPALHVARADVSALMKSGGRPGFGSLRGRRWMLVFLTAECGLTMVLLNAIVTGVRTTREMGRRFMPIDAANVLTTWVTLPADRYRTPDARRAFYAAVDERIAAMPGVSVAALATALPLGGASARSVTIDGRARGSNETPPTVWTVTIGSRYFDAIGVALARGRTFDSRDGLPGYESAIVNQRFVDQFFGGGDALGRRLGLSEPGAPAAPATALTIVGVVPPVRQRSQSAEADPIVYLPLAAAAPASVVLLVRGPADAASSAPQLREVVRAIDPELPLYRTLPLAQALDASNWNGRVSAFLLNGIAVVAICLAGIGLYAVMTHAVLQRTREIGIRVALGARRGGLIAMMARSAVAYLALGSGAGLLCVIGFGRLIESGAGSGSAPFRLSDSATSVAAIGLLAIITAAASIAPTWRASRVDPARVLRDG